MPLPDILPPEIWYNIIEMEEFSVRDKRAMLAVAPLTTAKGMHDAAFSALFQSLNIKFSGEYDPARLASKLSLYSASDSWRLRFAVHYLHLSIDLNGFSKNTASSLRIENCAPFIHLLDNERITDFLKAICDVLTTLPNLTEVEWIDVDPVSSRKERRWGCICSCLPQLTKLILRRFEFKYPLDLQTAKSLRCLSLQHCQFNSSNDDPWIISDAKIRTLLFSLENNPRPDQLELSSKPLMNIFSRAGLDLSSLTTFVLDIQSLSTDDLSYLLPSSLSNNGSGLGTDLQCLTLSKVDYELALALGNSSRFPSLRSCSLLFSKNQVTSRKFSSSMRYLCVFLTRHISLEVLVFGVSDLVLMQETNPTLRAYDTELCSENFVNTLLLLENLKRLNLICYNFSLNHPALRISPLANLEFLVIQTTHTVLLPVMACTVAEKLKPHPALRSFTLNIYGDDFPDLDALNFFAQKLKEISTQVKFAAVNYVSFWLQNEDKPEPDRLDPGHFMYQSYVKLLRAHKDVYVGG